MNRRRFSYRHISLCGIVGFFGLMCATVVQAHNPGLSFAEIELSDSRVLARLTYSRRDIAGVLSIDSDGDGSISPEELARARPRITAWARNLIDVHVDNRRSPMVSTPVVELEQNDGIIFNLSFEKRDGSSLRVEASLIERFARGHRLFLSVVGQDGRTRTGVLSAAQPSLEVDLKKADPWRQLARYFREGVWHIWIGFDHLLFLVALLLPTVLRREGGRWQAVESLRPALISVAGIVTAFSVAHSVTLSAAVLGWVSLPSRWVESAIAATVVLAALNNLYPLLLGQRWVIAFGLGLVHGFGFAGALSDLGLPSNALALALVGFNLGVETGQLAVVGVFVPIAFVLRETWSYQRAALGLGSLAVAVIATGWLLERSLDLRLTPL